MALADWKAGTKWVQVFSDITIPQLLWALGGRVRKHCILASWCTSLILALEMQRQMDLYSFRAAYSEFKDSKDYIVRPCFKTNQECTVMLRALSTSLLGL